MYQNMASPQPGRVDEIVALAEILAQVLLWGIGRGQDEIFLFLKENMS